MMARVVEIDPNRRYDPGVEKMTLRDYFAAKAMQALIAHYGNSGDSSAAEAYRMADSMMKAR